MPPSNTDLVIFLRHEHRHGLRNFGHSLAFRHKTTRCWQETEDHAIYRLRNRFLVGALLPILALRIFA